MWFL